MRCHIWYFEVEYCITMQHTFWINETWFFIIYDKSQICVREEKQEGNGPKDQRAPMIAGSKVRSDLTIELSDLNYPDKYVLVAYNSQFGSLWGHSGLQAASEVNHLCWYALRTSIGFHEMIDRRLIVIHWSAVHADKKLWEIELYYHCMRLDLIFWNWLFLFQQS